MHEETLKNQILMTCINEGIVLPYALKTLAEDERYINKVILKLTQQGLLTDRKITVKYKYTKYTVHYKAITQKGVQYLINNCSKLYPWLAYLPNPVPKFSLTQISDTEQLYRFLKSITVSIVFKTFNIQTAEKERTSIKNHKNIFYKEMIFEAMSRYKKDNGIVDNYAEEGTYYHSKDIAQYFNITNPEMQQYKFSQHIGILTLRSNSYFIYHTKQQGLKLNIIAIDRAKQSAANFITENHINTPSKIERGIIFCKNAAEFSKTFKRNYESINNWLYDKNKRLSKVFKSLYAVPINRNGVYMLDDILYYDENLHKKVKEKLFKLNPNFEEGIGGAITELMLNNSEAYIGIDMDMVKLQYFYHEVANNPNKLYTIICYKWQEEFYRKLFDNQVDYYIIDTNILLL